MGLEPTYAGFANRCLATWLPHREGWNIYLVSRQPVNENHGYSFKHDAAGRQLQEAKAPMV